MPTITFLKPYPPYNAGEHATFDEAAAAQLCARGVACVVATAPPEAAPVPSPDAASPLASTPAPKGKKG
jgi:hypothetical protein